jgi:hypothetical protein
MTEKEFISKIKELRSIKPDQDWAFSLKQRILAEEINREERSTFVLFRPLFAGLTLTFVFCFGLFGMAQNSVPGDFLYGLKKFSEKGQSFFVSEENKTNFSLALANERLEELIRMAEENKVRNLSSAISQAQISLSEASRSLASEDSDPEETRKIVGQLEERVQAVSSLGVNIETEEIKKLADSLNKDYAENLIFSIERATLTENQENVLKEMESLMEQGSYSEVVRIYELNFNQPVEETESIVEEEETEE